MPNLEFSFEESYDETQLDADLASPVPSFAYQDDVSDQHLVTTPEHVKMGGELQKQEKTRPQSKIENETGRKPHDSGYSETNRSLLENL